MSEDITDLLASDRLCDLLASGGGHDSDDALVSALAAVVDETRTPGLPPLRYRLRPGAFQRSPVARRTRTAAIVAVGLVASSSGIAAAVTGDPWVPVRFVVKHVVPELSDDASGRQDKQVHDASALDTYRSVSSHVVVAAADRTRTDSPAGDRPSTDTPVGDRPSTDSPAGDRPSTDTPVGDQPSTDTPADESSVDQAADQDTQTTGASDATDADPVSAPQASGGGDPSAAADNEGPLIAEPQTPSESTTPVEQQDPRPGSVTTGAVVDPTPRPDAGNASPIDPRPHATVTGGNPDGTGAPPHGPVNEPPHPTSAPPSSGQSPADDGPTGHGPQVAGAPVPMSGPGAPSTPTTTAPTGTPQNLTDNDDEQPANAPGDQGQGAQDADHPAGGQGQQSATTPTDHPTPASTGETPAPASGHGTLPGGQAHDHGAQGDSAASGQGSDHQP